MEKRQITSVSVKKGLDVSSKSATSALKPIMENRRSDDQIKINKITEEEKVKKGDKE